jgi:hypothetical protein
MLWLQYMLVGVIVTAALLFAIWRLPGHATRQRYVHLLQAAGGPLAVIGGRLQRRLDRARGGGACADCSTSKK